MAPTPAPVTEALKRQLKNDQDAWALGIARLELLNGRLDEFPAVVEP
jgi:hypothetical protein